MRAHALRDELHGGHVHRADLIDRGWRPDAIRRAAAAEGLDIVRRTWVVAPDAAAQIRGAAHAGGILSCVSACAWAGLWMPQATPVLHVSAHPHSGIAFDGVRVHRAIGPVPRPTRSLVDHPTNVLALVATCLPHDDALAVWESAVRKGYATIPQLHAVPWRGDRARTLALEASALSDSGLETQFVHGMRRRGIPVLQQAIVEGRPVDGLIGSSLVVQLDGWAFHSDAAQRRSDIAHDRHLRLRGYTVFRYDYREVMHEWPRVEAEILAAIAQRLHARRDARRRGDSAP